MNKVTPTRTIRVGAREANQQFSKLLREVEAGAEVIISRNGNEVAHLSAPPASVAQEDREKRVRELLDMMERFSFDSGGYKFNREDAYEDIHERYDRRQPTGLRDGSD
jgi:antitoxin (DNA-binding transcriptional repressor) of toxin-antitoxin stability system